MKYLNKPNFTVIIAVALSQTTLIEIFWNSHRIGLSGILWINLMLEEE